jgi:REP element-mobilizing transposase RayT
MALFQTSVLKSHLARLDQNAVDKAYKKYQAYFWNTTIQENIKTAKEEQYQATFLHELFVNILGYTLFPNPDSNLTTEFKNEKNARKADAAITTTRGLNSLISATTTTRGLNPLTSTTTATKGLNPLTPTVMAVIELKGTNTKDLESIRRQAFDYKANQKGCVYVITSNFEKLRFYINDATEFEEFDLFTLSRKRFDLLYLCLHLDKLLNNVPLKIKEASIAEEEQITKAFYKDYSVFKRELYRDLVKNNAKTVKAKLLISLSAVENDTDQEDRNRLEKNVRLTLFKKSQKLIDRFLFIFFAEDRMLLPSNSTLQILNKWKDDWDFGDERSLYQLFQQYFTFLDQGRKGTEKRAEIYAYNGGLFKPDAILDALEIDNDLLYKYTLKLSNYDFESQVDVNILGHIFENSLNEIESVNAEIEGGEFDKQTSKRKKDGVFYTPKYITKYIVENTLGKLCEEKKAALGFDEEQYFKGRKNRNKDTIVSLVAILDDYREWLLQITICDPACGSGAFLNQALDFLIKEHTYIVELKTKILGGGLQFPDIENTILENNIYGVDLNEESVEIAKLSLWLRTAQPRRKLNDLSSNIKCGNSLIDDKKVAGDKAFKWETAFAKVFQEKNKKTYHITTAIHDSRTSDRMRKYKVREKREAGTNPYPNVIYFTPTEDQLITETIAEVVHENQLHLLAYNICGDHIHLLLVCELEEIPSIMQKIKGRTSYKHGQYNKGTEDQTEVTTHDKGLKPLDKETVEEKKHQNTHKKPFWTQKYSAPKEITTEEQLQNTIKYIKGNRKKHELPPHDRDLQNAIDNMCCGVTDAFKTEYSGGFDVVIGNPPYTYRNAISESDKEYFKQNYDSVEGNYDLYKFFMERTSLLTKENGLSSFIVPNTFLSAKTYKKLRTVMLSKFKILELFDLGLDIFENVVVESVVYTVRKSLNNIQDDVQVKIQRNRKQPFEELQFQYHVSLEQYAGPDNTFNINISNDYASIINKMKSNSIQLSDFCYCTVGINTGYIKSELTAEQKVDSRYHKMLNGKDISRYGVNWPGEYIMYDSEFVKEKGKLGRALPPEYIFENHKILVQRTRRGMKRKLICYLDKNCYYNLNRLSNIVLKNEDYSLDNLYPLLNSTLLDFYFNIYFNEYEVKPLHLGRLPIPKSFKNDNSFLELSSRITILFDDLNLSVSKFHSFFEKNITLKKTSRKLESWHDLNFAVFIKELSKAIKKENGERKKAAGEDSYDEIPLLTKKDEFEWMELFEPKKQEAQELQQQIQQTEKEIDQMVYELYGLSAEEILIVEGS